MGWLAWLAVGIAVGICLSFAVAFMRSGGIWDVFDGLAPEGDGRRVLVPSGSVFLDADPVTVAPRPPTEIPHQAIEPWPSCPVCGVEAQHMIKAWHSPVAVGFVCDDHGRF